jgi:hypothetical protein
MRPRGVFHRGKATLDRGEIPDDSSPPIAQNGPVTIRDAIEKHGHFTDTVGFKVSDGDLEVEEARDLVGVH